MPGSLEAPLLRMIPDRLGFGSVSTHRFDERFRAKDARLVHHPGVPDLAEAASGFSRVVFLSVQDMDRRAKDEYQRSEEKLALGLVAYGLRRRH